MNPTHDKDDLARRYGSAAAALADLLTHPGRFRAWIGKAVTTTATPVPAVPDLPNGDAGLVLTDAGREALGGSGREACRCGDSDCADTFGRATEGQDRSGCCQYCGWFDCDVCGWTALAAGTCQVCDYAHPAGEPCRFAACARCDRLFESLSLSQYCPDCPPARTVPGSPAEILPLAAQYLERHGWIQGAYYDPTATVFTPAADLVGAIGMVCYGGPVEAPAQHFADPGFLDFEEAVLHLDRYLLVEDGSESYEFNDAKGRRKEDVIRVLRDAAARPAEELIDALRALSAQDVWTADRVRLLVPSGAFAAQSNGEPPVAESIGGACCPRCGSGERDWRQVVADDGSGSWGYCDHDWHNDGDSDGGDAR